jgi:hypothetical protein
MPARSLLARSAGFVPASIENPKAGSKPAFFTSMRLPFAVLAGSAAA